MCSPSNLGVDILGARGAISEMIDRARKLVTFFLAVFLWLHAVLFFNPQTAIVDKLGQFLSLDSAEVIPILLLVTFSLLSGTGYWRMFKSLLYIYFFPFVILWYAVVAFVVALGRINGWLNAQRAMPQEKGAAILGSANIESVAVAAVPQGVNTNAAGSQQHAPFRKLLLRPFQKFTFLWCILLVVSNHRPVLWLCLAIVLIHLARNVFSLLKFLFFSEVWWGRFRPMLFAGLRKSLDTLQSVTPEIDLTSELRTLVTQITWWEKVLNFLKDPYLVSRWGTLIVGFALGVVYLYFALIFSFCYHSIAILGGVQFEWPEAFVTSVFMPLLIGNIPRAPTALLVMGGIHGSLVVAIGIGTIITFFRRKLEDIRRSAYEMSRLLADQTVREKFLILESLISDARSFSKNNPVS